MEKRIEKLISEMTLEEKGGLCSGEGMWWTKTVERLGLGSIMVSDGPNGLRKQVVDEEGNTSTVEAISYPTGVTVASTFDRSLVQEEGKILGIEAKSEGVHTLLGPAINMKRSPLCGRNFEYFSEDPYLAGELSAAYTNGVQGEGVGVSVKHLAANNQEYCRMSTDEIISERALREIYFPAFENTVKKAKPWTAMCSYNRINGAYSSENKWLLETVMRDEWGFDGIVMTDWGAVNDRVKGIEAGLDLEMPGSFGVKDKEIVEAVREGRLSEAALDRVVGRLLQWILKGESTKAEGAYDKESHHAFSSRIAREGAVLLKNDDGLLPLEKGGEYLFVGSFAQNTRYQGGGSSHVTPYRVTRLLDEVKEMAKVEYAAGWNDDGETRDEKRLQEALAKAEKAEKVVVFAGLPDSIESEGFDRSDMNLPECQNELIGKLSAMRKDVIVVLFTGSPVEMPWVEKVPSILEMYLGGEGTGEALAALLFGDANPSGHLAETFPKRVEDNPSYLSFPGDGKKVLYGEDVFIGYRWYDKRRMDVLFPFGHGLSYTTFEAEDLKIVKAEGTDIVVSAKVRNTGKREGKAVLQLYVAPPKGDTLRPVRELKGFEKINLRSGEEKTVEFVLESRSFSYFEEKIHDWYYAPGEYRIEVGFSSRDIRDSVSVTLESPLLPVAVDDTLTLKDLAERGLLPILGESYVHRLFERFGLEGNTQEETALTAKAAESVTLEMPVKSIPSFIECPYRYKEVVFDSLRKEVE